jgi:hypothetical protein
MSSKQVWKCQRGKETDNAKAKRRRTDNTMVKRKNENNTKNGWQNT